MRTYKEFQPTGFDSKGAFIYDERAEWLVLPVGRNRDSDCLSESNFETASRMLKDACGNEAGENDDHTFDGDWQIHRFGHWANGWFEIIIARPDSKASAVADDLEASLSDYPVLDDSDYSEREWTKASEYWVGLGRYDMRERIRICDKYHESIFAARRDTIPENVDISYLAK